MSAHDIIAQEYFVRGNANIYALDYVALDNLHIGGRGNNTFDTNSRKEKNWWNFTVTVKGEVFYRPDIPPSDEELLGITTRSENDPPSILKVAITYPLGNSKDRTVLIDVGSGVDIYIPPTWKVTAQILGPDPDSIPENLPPNFQDGIEFATDLIVTARCVDAPIGISAATFTQPIAVPGGASVSVGRVEGARKAYVTGDRALGAQGLEYLLIRRNVVDGTDIDTTTLGEISPAALARFSDPDPWIPGPTNTLRYSNGPGALFVGSIVQKLEM